MKKILIILILAINFNGCNPEYSLAEKKYVDKIPSTYSNHNSGIIHPLKDTDIKEAIEFGKQDKDNRSLEYAYLVKGPKISKISGVGLLFATPSQIVSSDYTYIRIRTPLFLIADYARDQAREYRATDSTYVDYLKNLDLVQLDVVQQSSSTSTYYAFAFNREFILVRNGIRVEPVNKIISFKGQNPFKEKVDKSTEAIFNEMMKISAAYTRNLYLNMPESQKKQIVESYINMGLPREQIAIYTGLNSDEINEFMDIKNGHEIEIPLLETENIYSVKDLKQDGLYQIVFRTPKTNSLIKTDDTEIKFAIDFSKFK